MDWERAKRLVESVTNMEALRGIEWNFPSLNSTEVLEKLTHLLSSSNEVLDIRMLAELANNYFMASPAIIYALIASYIILIIGGAFGNGLVVGALFRNPSMRTVRNMFILNLAISDLVLCMFTMPLNLAELMNHSWRLGKQEWMCRLLGAFQAMSVYVSTISITAIAFDRYMAIVHPTRASLQARGAMAIIFLIWLLALLLASPLLIFRTLKEQAINLDDIGIKTVSFCVEEWPIEHGRAYYAFFALIVQYVLPIITIVFSYSGIARKLRERREFNRNVFRLQNATREMMRVGRTNMLLTSITAIFCISWLPLNVFEIAFDFIWPSEKYQHNLTLVYAICHVIAMSSACSNPVLYGWLNDNFREELKEMLEDFCPWPFLTRTVGCWVQAFRNTFNKCCLRQLEAGDPENDIPMRDREPYNDNDSLNGDEVIRQQQEEPKEDYPKIDRSTLHAGHTPRNSITLCVGHGPNLISAFLPSIYLERDVDLPRVHPKTSTTDVNDSVKDLFQATSKMNWLAVPPVDYVRGNV